MDEDKKSVSYSFRRSKWSNKISLLMGTVGVGWGIVPSLSASAGIKIVSKPSPETKQTDRPFPIISSKDAGSAQSRSQYGLQKCSWELEELKKNLSEDTADRVSAFVEFISKFTARNADLVYGQTLQARMTEKPTAEQVCFESLYIALEQTFFLTKTLGCLENLLERLRGHGLLFDTFREEFGNVTHLSQNQPDDGSGIVTAFNSEYAEKMEQRTYSIVEKYSNLFRIRNCPEEILALLGEYAKEIDENMTNMKANLGTSQASATLNLVEDTLARFIVSKTDEIIKKFPNEKFNEIYKFLAITALQSMLPTISQMGPLRAFANTLRDGGTPSLRKAFETKFRSCGTFINQGGPAEEEKEDADQSQLTLIEKREADRRKQKEKDRREAAAQKQIVGQTDMIVEWFLTITRGYVDTFRKRNTPNWPI